MGGCWVWVCGMFMPGDLQVSEFALTSDAEGWTLDTSPVDHV